MPIKVIALIIFSSAITLLAQKSFTIEADDLLRFSEDRIVVNTGEKVTITLKNVGQIPRIRHNLVIIKEDVSVSRFARAAMNAKDTGYIPAEMKDSVIAHTRVLSVGESQTISFTAPAPGTYSFFCSYPGHHSVFKGRLIVREN